MITDKDIYIDNNDLNVVIHDVIYDDMKKSFRSPVPIININNIIDIINNTESRVNKPEIDKLISQCINDIDDIQ